MTNRKNTISQQSIPKTHHLSMKGEFYLQYIKDGIKTHEGRVYRDTCSKMSVGDILILKDNHANKGIKCEITSCDRYPSFEAMLKAKGILNMLPQLRNKASQLSDQQILKEGVKIYQAFPGSHEVDQLGAIAIGVKYIQDI